MILLRGRCRNAAQWYYLDMAREHDKPCGNGLQDEAESELYSDSKWGSVLLSAQELAFFID